MLTEKQNAAQALEMQQIDAACFFFSAGRLYEKCLELLQGADIQFKRQHRLDVALVQNMPIALLVVGLLHCF